MDSVRPLPGNEIRASLPVASDSPSRVAFWLTVITIIAAAFRLWALGSKSLWFDEATSFWIARRSFSSVWRELSSPQAMYGVYYALYTPLYYAFLHFWMRLGESEFLLRLPSALFGLATVPSLYALGSRLFGKRTGLAAAFLLAVQPVHLAYSQEARSYALCVFLSVAAYYFLARALQGSSSKWWLLYVVSMVLAVYSHLFAVFLLPAQYAALLLRSSKVQFRSAILSAILLGLLVVPVFRWAMLKDPGRIPWGTKPNLWEILNALKALTGAGVKFPLFLGLLVMAGVSFYQGWRDNQNPSERWRHALVWGWLLVPVAIVVLAALWKPPLFPRYLILSLPAATLLAAVGLSRLRSTTRITAATVVLGVLFVPAIFSYYSKPKEDWRGATAYLLAHAGPDDGIVFFATYGQLPYDYYRQQIGRTLGGPTVNGPFVVLPGQAADLYRRPTMWLVLYGVHPNDANAAAWLAKTETSLEAEHQLVGRQHFYEIEILRYASKGVQSSGPER